MSRTATAPAPADTDTATAPGTELATQPTKALSEFATHPRAREIIDRRRAQRLPHVWAAATGAAGTAAWGAAEIAAAAGAPGLIATTATAAITSAGAGITWLARQQKAGAWRGRLAAGLAASATYVPLVSVTGMGWGSLATLLCTEAVIAARWWRHHRLPAGAPAPTDPAATSDGDVLVPDTDRIAHLWRTKLAGRNQRFAGSELYNIEPTKFGVSYTLVLDGAKHSFSSVMGGISAIAGVLKIAPIMVIPAMYEDGRVDRIQLQIVTASPIRDEVPYIEPRFFETEDSHGMISVGPYADGQGDALFRAWSDSSVYSGHIAGDQGSGKSATLNGIAVSLRASGKAVILYLDGAPAGGSSPFMAEFADFAAEGEEGAYKVLAILRSLAAWRSKENKVLGLEGAFKVSRERPAIFLIIDESHETFAIPGMAAAILALVRIIRKLGIGIITASQGIGVSEFGNDRQLRKLLTGWNLLVHRTAAVSEKNFVPGLDEVDPSTLPAIPGYGVAAAKDANARTAPFRSAFTKNWRQFLGLARCPLDEIAMLAADAADDNAQYWTRRTEEAHASLASARDDLAALRAGTWTSDQAAAETAGHQNASAQVIYADFQRELDALPSITTRHATGSTSVPVGLAGAELAVWEAIRDGHTMPVDIRRVTEFSETHVRNQLKKLVDRGLIHQPKEYGPYQLGTAAADAETA